MNIYACAWYFVAVMLIGTIYVASETFLPEFNEPRISSVAGGTQFPVVVVEVGKRWRCESHGHSIDGVILQALHNVGPDVPAVT
jgi:hypothetical protein